MTIPVLELVVSTQPGGGPEHVRGLAHGLGARGFAPVVAGPRDGVLFDRLRDEGIDVVEVATNRLRPATLGRVVALARARDVRLVHSHGKGAGLYGRLAARAVGIPAVHTFHGIHYEAYGPLARAGYLALERALGRMTAAIVNVSRVQEAEGLALRLFRPGQSRVVPNGVDVAHLEKEALTREDARKRFGLAPDAAVVGTVARFDPVKGVDLLVRAAARLPRATLVIVGDGPERERLHGLARGTGAAARVRFAGEIHEAWRLYRAFDVFATASAKEGLPLAVLEAMALGLPVVASDIPAHREVLGDEATTLSPRTEDGLGAGLAEVLGNAPVARAIGAANLERARREYGLERMLDGVHAAYRGVLGV